MGHRRLSALSTAHPSGVVARQVVANCKTEPSVTLTLQRLELIKAYAELTSSSIEVSKSRQKVFSAQPAPPFCIGFRLSTCQGFVVLAGASARSLPFSSWRCYPAWRLSP